MQAAVLPDQRAAGHLHDLAAREGLGQHCFADWRLDPGFILNRPEAEGARVLVVGENFGCGSSREHAPWALLDAGFRAIVARSFADIFRQNALKNGLLAIEVNQAAWNALRTAPLDATVAVDLDTIRLPDGSEAAYPLDPFRRACLAKGVDEIGFVLDQASDIAAFEARRVSRMDTRMPVLQTPQP